ncbi:MAG TPA: hypothetical protein PKH10_14115 [bacterium]|nr:hypothetical protein [bacterium]HSA33145.1 hypothetical protein [bacterium]
MRNALLAILFLSLLPILPLAAQEDQPVKPSSEIEPGKDAPGWEARFRKEKGKEHAEEKKERRKEMKKEKKKEHKEEDRDQKKEQRHERKREHSEHR